jgi:hypothetical protein
MRIKLPRGAARAYILAGIVTWPVATAVIWGVGRLMVDLPGLGQAGDGIGFWPASGCALVVSLLIVIAGWLQSSHPS